MTKDKALFILDEMPEWNNDCRYSEEEYEEVIKLCKSFLSIPERSKGHWIPVYGKNGKTIMSYKCSECQFHPKHAIITDFCGGCGSDMRGTNV